MLPKATVRRNKAVLVTVFVEKPRRRRVSLDHHHHHHHHHYVHKATKQEVIKRSRDGSSKGSDRRAELLYYSQRLRESARLAASKAIQPKPMSPNNHQPKTQNLAIQRNPSYRVTPCFGNWKVLFPRFLTPFRSLQAKKERKKKKKGASTSNKMKAIMKTLELPKNRGFISRMFSRLRKRR